MFSHLASHAEAVLSWLLQPGVLPHAEIVGLGGNTLKSEDWATLAAPCREARPLLKLAY